MFGLREWSGDMAVGETVALISASSPLPPHPCNDDDVVGACEKDSRWIVASTTSGWSVVPPGSMGRFLCVHQQAQASVVVFDVVQVYASICRTLDTAAASSTTTTSNGNADGAEERLALLELVNQNGVHDLQLMDQLLQLAQHDVHPTPRSLVQILREFLARAPPTSSSFDLGSVLAVEDARTVDPTPSGMGSASGPAATPGCTAVSDWELLAPVVHEVAKAMLTVWDLMVRDARALVTPDLQPELLDQSESRFGLLTESVQVKAAVALHEMRARGVGVDERARDRLHSRLQAEQAVRIAEIRAHAEWRALFAVNPSTGDLVTSRVTGKPTVVASRLREILLQVADQIHADHGIDVQLFTDDHGKLVTAVWKWAPHAALNPFLRTWTAFERDAKLLSWLAQLAPLGPEVRPRWSVMKRNGRTACSTPNLQAVPRAPGFRDLFRPPRSAGPGAVFLIADYSFIELCTLAAVCERRYGRSVLAEVIRAGHDPHSFTAAMLEGLSLDEFMALRQTDPGRFKERRQRAKAVNFGLPGGESPATLKAHVAASYGVQLTLDEAATFRHKLLNEVFPELGMYVAEDSLRLLAVNLGVGVADVWQALGLDRKPAHKLARTLTGMRHVVSGRSFDLNGRPYKRSFVERVWRALTKLNRNPALADRLEVYEAGPDLLRALFCYRVTTLTGRIRGGVSYTQARNTPFSGLAADGAKLALWNLTHVGFQVVAFIHDEFVIALPPADDYSADAELVSRIMCEAMEEVTPGIPIKCEYTISPTWSKQCEAQWIEDRLVCPDLARNPVDFEDDELEEANNS